jgi:hypothetical protein
LVARNTIETMAGNEVQWKVFIEKLQRLDNPKCFVEAILACLEARAYGRDANPVSESILMRLRVWAPFRGAA